jgi:two-component system, NtrC family, nitrogen regulation response regulator NtrX
MTKNIVIVDDEQDIRDLVCDILGDEGYNCFSAADGTQAMKLFSEKRPSVIILDVWLEGSEMDGLGILEFVRSRMPSVPVIMISGHGTIEMAVSSIKMGAYDYIQKPFTEERLVTTVKRAVQVNSLNTENAELKRKVRSASEMIGSSIVMTNLRSQIDKISTSASSRVLITGEVGSGKEMVARLIHAKSKRSAEPFVAIRPANHDEIKVINDLFGDAESIVKPRKLSILEKANLGTLFIDEIAALSPKLQTLLLKFLQSSQVRLPDNKSINLDVRVMASTRFDLEQLAKEGLFNKDLYYRINVMSVTTPSLSERKDDVPALCEYFVKNCIDYQGMSPKTISQELLAELQLCEWPGNVRQLKNTIEHMMNMANVQNTNILTSNLLTEVSNNESTNNNNIISGESIMSLPLREAREIFEKFYLTSQMKRFSGNISKTSSFVGMERSALHRKLKSLSILSTSINDEAEEEALVG